MESTAIVSGILYFLVLCITLTLGDSVCENVKIGSAPSIVPEPSDCTAFHVCFSGRGWKFSCGAGFGNKVFDPISRTCVLKRSEHDRSACKYSSSSYLI